jgi:4-amino-4-deoxy-L-arabinose transferase-like glycosyltransferase
MMYFVIMASRHIALPGLYYDEVLFVNAATGGAHVGFVANRVMGIPIMLMPYIGALKAWLYFPIFSLFGISPASIRLPTIFIALLTLGLTFKLARSTFGPNYSALLVLLMAVDPIFIVMSKLDSGPTVLMMFFKTLALWFFFRLLLTSSQRYLWGLAITCSLGLFDKLNFIWFMLALVVAAALVFARELRHLAVHQGSRLFPPVAMFFLVLVGSGLYAAHLLAQTRQPGTRLLPRLAFVSGLYRSTMNGTDVWFVTRPFAHGTLVNWTTVGVLATIAVAGLWHLGRGREAGPLQLRERAVVFYLLVFLTILGQLIVTSAAESPHHIMMLYPFHLVLLIGVASSFSEADLVGSTSGEWQRPASSAASDARYQPGSAWKRHWPVHVAFGAVATPLVVSQLVLGYHYQQAIDDRAFNRMWSPAIYQLARYVDRRNVDGIVSADWGIHNQVFALSEREGRHRYADLWQEFVSLTPENGRRIARKYFVGKRVFVLTYEAEQKDRRTRQQFLRFAEQYFGGAMLKHVITDDRGEPIFRVYCVDARRAPRGYTGATR